MKQLTKFFLLSFFLLATVFMVNSKSSFSKIVRDNCNASSWGGSTCSVGCDSGTAVCKGGIFSATCTCENEAGGAVTIAPTAGTPTFDKKAKTVIHYFEYSDYAEAKKITHLIKNTQKSIDKKEQEAYQKYANQTDMLLFAMPKKEQNKLNEWLNKKGFEAINFSTKSKN